METIFRNNREWADGMRSEDPGFFDRLKEQQSPRYFWIGCADSRVPANVVCGLEPGEVFVQRNVANVVHSSDMNLLSTLEYAVEVLQVAHVVICGHYGCGGVKASTEDYPKGLADHWLQPIRRLAMLHAEELGRAVTQEAKLNRLAELNVMEGVRRVAESPILRRAWGRGQDIAVHGLIYGLGDGRLRDLGCSVQWKPTELPET